jgi:hypothetical protein
MHPMLVKLFIETGADDLLATEGGFGSFYVSGRGRAGRRA